MSKFHTTVSRRNFMKGIGLGAAGLGAAAAATPVFHDMDELATAPEGARKVPLAQQGALRQT
jgi:anaerobic selenocysteine-containing dehydrogenase